MSNEGVAQDYLNDARKAMRAYKKLADKALAQLKEEEYFVTLDEESNSISVVMKHIAGNAISRWTDFLTSDGEKPDRNRDYEFVILPETTKDEMHAFWERSWQCVFDALDPLQSEDLEKKVYIRGEEHTVVQAINRQLMHYAYHIGQIVCLSKHFGADAWTALTIPRGRSREFTTDVQAGTKSQR